MRARVIGNCLLIAVGCGVVAAFSAFWWPVLVVLMGGGLIGGIAVNISSYAWRMTFVVPAVALLREAAERGIPASAVKGAGDYVLLVMGALSWMAAVGLLARPGAQAREVAGDHRSS